MDIEENIYEPLDLFQSRYKDAHAKNVSDFFEDLVRRSGIDAAKNADTVSKIKAKQQEITSSTKKLSGKRALRGFVIFLIVILAIAIIFFVFEGWGTDSPLLPLVGAILGIVGAVLGIVGLGLLIGLNLNKAIHGMEAILAKLNAENNALIAEAWSEMRSLNALFDWGMTQSLVEKTIPLVKLDPYFDNQRFETMNVKYGLSGNTDPNSSVVYVQSGEIIGNPFLLARTYNTWIGSKTYTGTLTITWTTSRYVDGKWETETHTETLTAHLDKPFPCFGGRTYVVYGNEAAPDLSFSRVSSGANGMSDHEIAKFVERKGKEIEKKSEKAVTSGNGFTAMAETDFEALFGALDRDNEIQFRLLFTPLAQRETLKLIKDKTVGFGDDWSFVKRKCLNYVEPSHLAGFDISANPDSFMAYDLAAARKFFNDYNNSYFRAFYFAMAPLLAIPLYQQQKPQEYIYKNILHSNLACYEHEYLANQLSIDALKHPESVTGNILKTELIASFDSADEIRVTAKGNKGIPRIDYVDVLGGDGRLHAVPVPWVEYIPVSKTTNVVVQKADKLTESSYVSGKAASDWAAILGKASGSSVYRQALLAFIVTAPLDGASLAKLGETLKK